MISNANSVLLHLFNLYAIKKHNVIHTDIRKKAHTQINSEIVETRCFVAGFPSELGIHS